MDAKRKEVDIMSYYGYVRVSTETQVEKGYGLDTQRKAIDDYCKSNGIELSGMFSDEGISGTIADRDGLSALISAMNKNDSVIVLNTSRLWRSDSVKVLVHHELKKESCKIISIEQPTYDIYSTDPNDFLFNGMMELLDQYERLTITKKLAKGRVTKASKGEKSCGSAPYGYKWQDKEIVIDYNNDMVVRQIFTWFAENQSLSVTAGLAEAKGYKTSTGRDFSKQSISNMLHNDFYIGIVTHGGQKYHGKHDPIVDRDLFMRCNPGYELAA